MKEQGLERITIIGSTGSGKSTLSRQVASALGLPVIELDAIHWRTGNWVELPKAEFRATVAEAVSAERWIVEGNYSIVRPLVWARAQSLIWLDYSLPFTMRRLVRRTSGRVLRREMLWGGNRESLVRALSRDSILLWLLHSHARNRRKFAAALALPEHRHLRVYRFRSPRETEAWLEGLVSQQDPGQ